jgi:ketosteroid isomerase-like protein
MTTEHTADEAAIRRLIEKLAEAIRTMDFDSMKECFASDMVSFDVGGPPLQTVGAAAKLKNWETAFTVFKPPLGYEIRDLTITVGDDVAFGHSFNRFSGRSENGDRIGPWVRYTAGFRKIEGNWFIAHDQVSVPADFGSGRALLNLEP